MSDRIHIRDLLIRPTIGIYDWEQRAPQDVLVNLTLHADLTLAGRSDRIEDTVDYKALKQRILALEGQRFGLLERLAATIADLCLADERVQQVEVCVDKPGALRFARSVAVELSRSRARSAPTPSAA